MTGETVRQVRFGLVIVASSVGDISRYDLMRCLRRSDPHDPAAVRKPYASIQPWASPDCDLEGLDYSSGLLPLRIHRA
jgi:hypothetical protein